MSDIFQGGSVLRGCAYSVFPGGVAMIDSGITMAFKRRISLNTFSCIRLENPNFEKIVILANDANDRDWTGAATERKTTKSRKRECERNVGKKSKRQGNEVPVPNAEQKGACRLSTPQPLLYQVCCACIYSAPIPTTYSRPIVPSRVTPPITLRLGTLQSTTRRFVCPAPPHWDHSPHPSSVCPSGASHDAVARS
jgi:hypothetical protein